MAADGPGAKGALAFGTTLVTNSEADGEALVIAVETARAAVRLLPFKGGEGGEQGTIGG